ncbi:hypothetical protein ACFSX9_00320 [Flavobacterium ardleyense]|uniref:Uncharacterized protein n=1 Tax=Flavobacterium ardleyense TaxID=2038737 RepID=A0ABW5Z3F8_9FLAO
MKKIIYTLIISGTLTVSAQVGINTTSPASSLDILAANATGSSINVEGLLIPRVDRLRAQSMLAVPNSTILYVDNITTGALSGQASNISSVGYYYYNATSSKWVKLVAGDLTSDAFVDNPTSTRVELGTKSTGATRDANTAFVIKDNGNVGIKTDTPSQTLHVVGNTRLDGNIVDGSDVAGVEGQVLSIESGKVKWKKNTGSTSAVFATFGSGYSGTSSLYVESTGTTIVLPPGKWIVYTNILITTTTLTEPSASQATFVRLTWSDGATTTQSSDIVGGHLASGALVGPTTFGMATGAIIINNGTGADKTYYLTKSASQNYPNTYVPNFLNLGGDSASENNIVAIPAN